MTVCVSKDSDAMARAAAADAAAALRQAVDVRGEARLIVATGASQFGFLQALTQAPGIAWPRVTAFHLDEYVGLPVTHRASFRAYLRQRFAGALPMPLRAFVEVDGEAADLAAECDRLKRLIDAAPIDVACVGIGENGHLAFNDPPADFDAEDPFLVITLDEACRRQQLGEGWFPTLDAVPKRALTMSVPQIMSSAAIVNVVPDLRKAEAVKNALEGPLTNMCPASILMTHPDCHTFLDDASASLLKRKP